MLIKKIKLSNIRSYINEEIDFDKGITLLSGNIGSGKSTILLAIDFALFGLRKGYLSGSALLRNGEQHGSVELLIEIDNKEINIKRNLKRTQNSITQDFGTLKTQENPEREYASVELKQFIIQTLNYPKEYLTKSKYFIYNYTIYTPQEDMKQILLGEREYRLDTIRKVFGIDKYQRIKENSKILQDFIRAKRKESVIIVDTIYDKIKEKELKENKIKFNDNILEESKNNLYIISNKISQENKKIQTIESSIKDLNNYKKDLEIKEFELNYKNKTTNKNESDIKNLEFERNKLITEIIEISGINKEERINKENLLKKINEELNELNSKDKFITIKKLSSLENIKNIIILENCPTCKQNVHSEHKNNIILKENENIEIINKEKSIINNSLLQLNKEQIILKQKIDDLIKKEVLFEINNIKKKNLEEKTSKIEEIRKHNLQLFQDILNINELILKLKSLISNFLDLDKIYLSLKEDLLKLNIENKNLEIKISIIENENNNYKKELEKLKKEIEIINEIKKKLAYYIKLQDFLDTEFISILESIEKKVLLKIKNDFDIFFQKWFYMLVDSEMIKVKLDEEFSPLIEQAGHEIEYINLSGGEKTAAALAYRLALNQIINTFVSEIKTKDLLILDEPTDGFSSEQLDRLRVVLEELNINQIIIVSHENKIESFVDRIIKLEKTEHITRKL